MKPASIRMIDKATKPKANISLNPLGDWKCSETKASKATLRFLSKRPTLNTNHKPTAPYAVTLMTGY